MEDVEQGYNDALPNRGLVSVMVYKDPEWTNMAMTRYELWSRLRPNPAREIVFFAEFGDPKTWRPNGISEYLYVGADHITKGMISEGIEDSVHIPHEITQMIIDFAYNPPKSRGIWGRPCTSSYPLIRRCVYYK